MATTKTKRSGSSGTLGKKTPIDWEDSFLAAFQDTGMVSAACKLAGIGRTTAYRHRQADEDFALAWHDIEQETTDRMEREAYRRGVEGCDEPVFHKGEEIATIKRFSDTLLIFMLKARDPEKYRDRYEHKHSGKIETSGTPDLSQLDLGEARELKRLLAKAQREKAEA